MEKKPTLVAFYGDSKPEALVEYISRLQGMISRSLGSVFDPKPIYEVHATLVGLEAFGSVESDDELSELRDGRSSGPDIPGLCRYLDAELARLQPDIQFGGFQNRDYELRSRDSRLYDRAVTANAGSIVMMGWPVDADGEPKDTLNKIRWQLPQFGAVHRYFRVAEDRDPDAYMVIGYVEEGKADIVEQLRHAREYISRRPLRVRMTGGNLRIAAYSDTRLPQESTRTWPLSVFL